MDAVDPPRRSPRRHRPRRGLGNSNRTYQRHTPHPERNADLTRKLAAALHRPAILAVPGFALKLVLGGFGGALLTGQRALPAALEADGFRFQFPTLEAALADLV